MLAWKQLQEFRDSWIRTKLASGWYTSTIIDEAQLEPCFRVKPFAKHLKDCRQVMSRKGIRVLICGVKKRIREERVEDPKELIDEAYERLLLMYRTAVANGDVQNGINACREINRLFGVSREKIEVGFDVASLREQMLEMDKVTHGG